MTVIPRHGYDSERDDYLVPPPELPHVPEPTVAYGWGMDHLLPWRERERLLATWAIEEAHAEAIAAMGRDVQLVAARTERDRALRALGALDAPTIPITPVPETGKPDTDDAEQATVTTGWDPTDRTLGSAKDRARRWLFDRWAEDPERTFTVRKINEAVGSHDGIKGPDINTWRQQWERDQA